MAYTTHSIYWLLVIEEVVAGLTGAGMCEFAQMMSMVTDRARDISKVCKKEKLFIILPGRIRFVHFIHRF